jgi:uncharacterized protein YjbI with pentapeptide repeats
LDLSRQGQINDRFTKAIEQLGASNQAGEKKLEVRLGGIYALEQIAKESQDYHGPIVEVLTAYVRAHAPWKEAEQCSQEEISSNEPQPTQNTQAPPKLAADIQAILTVLGRRTRTSRQGDSDRPDLRDTDLRGADFRNAHLEGADLWGAHLEGALLGGAHLEGAYLLHAHLERADLRDAHLEGAHLSGAHLERADLWGAHLEEADLWGAHLERADLQVAHLEGANLWDAHLEGADLGGAHLERANLRNAHLERADLSVAYLERALLHDAHLEGAQGLTIAQLATVLTRQGAYLDPPLMEQLQRE